MGASEGRKTTMSQNNNTISRRAAIDAIINCTDVFINNLPTMIYKTDAQDAIYGVPSVQPEQKWIPCTPKTMPPYWVLVWVTDNHGHVAVCQLSHEENHYWYDGDERWMYEHDSIIAWMPYNVPEPYQIERREV